MKWLKSAIIGLSVLMLGAGLSHADCDPTLTSPSYTSRTGLTQLQENACNWGTVTNNNWAIADSSMCVQTGNNTMTGINSFSQPVLLPSQTSTRYYDSSTHYIEIKSPGSVTTTTFYLPIADGSSGQCLSTDGAGQWGWATTAGGAGSTLAVTTGSLSGFSVVRSSPTRIINAESTQFNVTPTGGATAYFALNPSSVTLQGNTFNGASKLVQLNASAQLPAVDGSLLTGVTVTGGLPAGSTSYWNYPSTGTFVDAFGASVSTLTATTAIIDSSLSAGQCVQTGAGGLLTTTGGACGSGGGGGGGVGGTVNVSTQGNLGYYSGVSSTIISGTDQIKIDTITKKITISTVTISSATITNANVGTIFANNEAVANALTVQQLSVNPMGVLFVGSGASFTFNNTDGSGTSSYGASGSGGTVITTIGTGLGGGTVETPDTLQVQTLTPSRFVKTDASDNLTSASLFGDSNTWTASQSWTSPSPSTFTALSVSTLTVTSSATLSNASGVNITYGLTVGSITVNNSTASQVAQFDANKQLVSSALIASQIPMVGIPNGFFTTSGTIRYVNISTPAAVGGIAVLGFVPAGKIWWVTKIDAVQSTGAGLNGAMLFIVGGATIPVAATATLTTNTISIQNNNGFVLPSGSSVAYWNSGAGNVAVYPQIIEMTDTGHFKTAYLASLTAGTTTTLYTVPAGKTAIVVRMPDPTVASNCMFMNESGVTMNRTWSFTPSGGSRAQTSLVASAATNALSVSECAPSMQAGDAISFFTDTTFSGYSAAWVTLLEL